MKNKSIPKRLPSSMKGLEQMIIYISQFHNTKKLTILEIGSWVGISTELFAKYFNKVFACDPWNATIGINTQYNMKEVEKEFDNRCDKYKNIEKIKMTSEQYSKTFHNDRAGFDVIYIDGAHDIVNVCRDIILWRDRARLYLCGHDFCDKFPGVKKAVKGLLGQPDKIFPDSSWLVNMDKR